MENLQFRDKVDCLREHILIWGLSIGPKAWHRFAESKHLWISADQVLVDHSFCGWCHNRCGFDLGGLWLNRCYPLPRSRQSSFSRTTPWNPCCPWVWYEKYKARFLHQQDLVRTKYWKVSSTLITHDTPGADSIYIFSPNVAPSLTALQPSAPHEDRWGSVRLACCPLQTCGPCNT